MLPIFFSTQKEFRKWLEKNHTTQTELLVGFYKVGSNKPSITWSQSVDEALCFGWIDGIRKSVDFESYCIRFTPRKTSSTWSAINIKKVEELKRQGLMHPAGLAAFMNRKEEKSKIYSFENDIKELTEKLEKQFKANKKAWEFFMNQPPSYKKLAYHWIMFAKLESTQFSRLEKVIDACEMQKRLWDKYK